MVKIHIFFKQQIKNKINFKVVKNLRKAISEIIKDIKISNINKKSILFSPASASYDQYLNFEKRGEEFKKLSKYYAKRLFKIINYWRNIDKKIFFCFLILFFLVCFFLFHLPHL